MTFIFNEFIYRPIYNLLIFVYNILPWADFGIAIVIVTILIKFLLIPISRKQIESQKKMQELQPKIKEIQQKYKNDKEKQSRALMEFYKENKTNPFSGCLPTIFQLIFLIAIYRVLFNISNSGLMVSSQELYSFVPNPGQINQFFLGLIDLSKKIDLGNLNFSLAPQMGLVFLAAAAQYYQMKMLSLDKKEKKEEKKNDQAPDFSQIMTKQMVFLGPIMTLYIGFIFPAGLSLYWLVSTVFAIIQQSQLAKKTKKDE